MCGFDVLWFPPPPHVSVSHMWTRLNLLCLHVSLARKSAHTSERSDRKDPTGSTQRPLLCGHHLQVLLWRCSCSAPSSCLLLLQETCRAPSGGQTVQHQHSKPGWMVFLLLSVLTLTDQLTDNISSLTFVTPNSKSWIFDLFLIWIDWRNQNCDNDGWVQTDSRLQVMLTPRGPECDWGNKPKTCLESVSQESSDLQSLIRFQTVWTFLHWVWDTKQ